MGIPVKVVVLVAFALSTLFAGVAGALVAPLFNVHSDMGNSSGPRCRRPFWAVASERLGRDAGLLFASVRR
jgi:hypothetical protein